MRQRLTLSRAFLTSQRDEFAWNRLVENVTNEPDGEIMLLMGFVNLAGELGIKLEKATGQTMRTHLQDIALKYL